MSIRTAASRAVCAAFAALLVLASVSTFAAAAKPKPKKKSPSRRHLTTTPIRWPSSTPSAAT